MDKEQVIKTWACSGINDFFLSFCLCETFRFQKPFFYHQGLEKLCKAYLLALESSEYENLPEKEAKEKIDNIARTYSHDIIKLIKRLIDVGVFAKSTLTSKQFDLTGEDIAKLLIAGYTECRYPAKEPSYKNHPIPNTEGYWVYLHSSETCDFAYNLGRILNERIERDFHVSTFDILSNKMTFFNRDNWVRFCRIFYKKEIGT